MADGDLPYAPIWDDVRTLDGRPWRGLVDIVYGGFPCQDISCAGTGAGLDGKRSGLFFEIMRIADEVRPTFLFFENVPAIRTRGLDRVLSELAVRGYDCRWRMLSAQEIGAPHKRNRWFLLAANTNSSAFRDQPIERQDEKGEAVAPSYGETQLMADATGEGLEASWRKSKLDPAEWAGWWSTEPRVCRVAHGTANRVDRVKALGNGVVPAQVREAFRSMIFG
jgi:DNA (cytosine-5)-methyltransferase 1